MNFNKFLGLHEAGLLSPDQTEAFGDAVWSEGVAETGLPKNMDLRLHVAYSFPGGNKETIDRQFRKTLFEKGLKPSLNGEILAAVAGATQTTAGRNRSLALDSKEALELWDAILAWKPRPTPLDLDGNDSAVKAFGGYVITGAVMPFVRLNELGNDRIDTFFSRIEEGGFPSLIFAVPSILAIDAGRLKYGIGCIHKALFARDDDSAVHAMNAISNWRIRSKTGDLDAVPLELKQAVCTVVETARWPSLPSALDVVAKFVEDHGLAHDEMERIADGLARLRAETAYDAWDPADRRTKTMTRVRVECVRLAHKLRNAGGIEHDAIDDWLTCVNADPIPEVRYALERMV